jgi:hypothetical protein
VKLNLVGNDICVFEYEDEDDFLLTPRQLCAGSTGKVREFLRFSVEVW